MLKSLFSEAGMAGVGFLLIIAGIILAQMEGMIGWTKFCISLGISLLFIILASKTKGAMQIITSIIGGGAFVAAIVFLANAV